MKPIALLLICSAALPAAAAAQEGTAPNTPPPGVWRLSRTTTAPFSSRRDAFSSALHFFDWDEDIPS